MIHFDHESGERIIYRNGDCASCDLGDEWRNKTSCLNKTSASSSLLISTKLLHFEKIQSPLLILDRNESLRQFQENMIKNTFKYTPESISILINFGFYDKHFLYSAESHLHNCQPYQIWDPFSKVCRTLFCSSKFDLGDLSCIDDSDGAGNGESILDPNPVPVSSNVELNMTVYIKFDNDTSEDIIATLYANFTTAFAHILMISPSRISNISVIYDGIKNFTTRNETINQIIVASLILLKEGYWEDTDLIHDENEFTDMVNEIVESNKVHVLNVNFQLNETAADVLMTTDRIVALIAELIGTDSLMIKVGLFDVRIVSVHEKTTAEKSELEAWCR